MAGDYTLDNLEERTERAMRSQAAYIADCQERYFKREEYRQKQRIKVVAFCGHNRAGKDTAAEYLSRIRPGVIYGGSLSSAVMPILADVIGVSVEEATANRQAHFDFWIAAFHALRRHDAAFVMKAALALGDNLVGIRDLFSLDVGSITGLFYTSVWIENPRVSANPTVEYGPADCDSVIYNAGSHLEFYSKLRRFNRMLAAAPLEEGSACQ